MACQGEEPAGLVVDPGVGFLHRGADVFEEDKAGNEKPRDDHR
ncbi:MAG: hypothetical protein PVF34_02045 [Gammaproteobacteria bacterium]